MGATSGPARYGGLSQCPAPRMPSPGTRRWPRHAQPRTPGPGQLRIGPAGARGPGGASASASGMRSGGLGGRAYGAFGRCMDPGATPQRAAPASASAGGPVPSAHPRSRVRSGCGACACAVCICGLWSVRAWRVRVWRLHVSACVLCVSVACVGCAMRSVQRECEARVPRAGSRVLRPLEDRVAASLRHGNLGR